jgi:hypothetical protein
MLLKVRAMVWITLGTVQHCGVTTPLSDRQTVRPSDSSDGLVAEHEMPRVQILGWILTVSYSSHGHDPYSSCLGFRSWNEDKSCTEIPLFQ